ncbi:hypothetical protein K1T35_48420 (plasmid) [Pseudonocardia sp. DSM 110487]|uniref:hypothetical protein n=1 Tax=Pseudonocardia sp. DSM 110487 TaxID=2865833 RepID=UPI001C6A5261|nr:hypothetical protein [Pseudonocardia sp. DSM 110487]QYN41174.1 hypothetical protein K1T35_48420 [Pseudonocardia sp. DSM 110487]
MTHLIITLPTGQQVERWTDTPEITERFYREAGAAVLEGGVVQPVYKDADIDACSAFPSRR